MHCFAVLGPLHVEADGAELAVSGKRLRALLVRLLLARGRPVPAGRLIEDLWEGDAPPGARSTLSSHVSRLRRLLGPAAVAHSAGGYAIALSPADQVDMDRFEDQLRAAKQARRTGDHHRAIDVLDEGLAWWRGPALLDVAGAPWALAEAARLDELRLVAVDLLLRTRLETGQHEDVAAEAAAVVESNPLQESAWAHLMLALYRCGRQSDALRAFRRLRGRLADELGIEPGPDVAALEDAILRQSPDLLVTSASRPGPTGR